MNIKTLSALALFLLAVSALSYADISDYLILETIGSYKFKTQIKDPSTKKHKSIPEYIVRGGHGNLGDAGHFSSDHMDITYEIEYENDVTGVHVKVQVTRHEGGDSDKWLLHEVERKFRKGTFGEEMKPSNFREIDGNKILYRGIAGGRYRWVHDNTVIDIGYSDITKQKPEPIEIVQAYLCKFPSTLPDVTVNDSYNEKWIKDEMARLLWLSDKWMEQIKTPGADTYDKQRLIKTYLYRFIDFRSEYYGIKDDGEKKLIYEAQKNKDTKTLEKKLNEFHKWWDKNKDKKINLIKGMDSSGAGFNPYSPIILTRTLFLRLPSNSP